MKSRSSISSKSNSIDSRFTNLNNEEMINLRGGEIPPLPPTGGDDYPIDLLKKSQCVALYTMQMVPVLEANS